jgi:hypothetical protein
MDNELTNLLPPLELALFRRRYFMRLIVVGIVLLAFLLLAGAVFLFPVHQFLTGKIKDENELLQRTTGEAQTPEDIAFASRLTALAQNAERIKALAGGFSVTATLRSVLDTPREGVTLSAVSLMAPGKAPGQVTLTGVAKTREALRAYQLAFENEPSVAAANLPVSVYAKDSDIPFTLTLSLTTP